MSPHEIKSAFALRTHDDELAKIGHKVSRKVLSDVEAVWIGYQFMTCSEYLDAMEVDEKGV